MTFPAIAKRAANSRGSLADSILDLRERGAFQGYEILPIFCLTVRVIHPGNLPAAGDGYAAPLQEAIDQVHFSSPNPEPHVEYFHELMDLLDTIRQHPGSDRKMQGMQSNEVFMPVFSQ